MECNKEEAIRAMKLAEKKIQEQDYVGAQKTVEKAQRLNPELENVSRLLTICEVHRSSQVKIGGTEMDWYGILKIEQSVDEAAIKKQYKKLALLLHPDKNKFAGAEAAFKLICEAHRVLSDQTKRGPYDRKCSVLRNAVRKPSSQFGADNSKKFTRPQNISSHPNAFWTCCPFCCVKYQYMRSVVERVVLCQSCRKQFVAHDYGPQPPSAPFQAPVANQQEVPNQRHQDVPSQVRGNSFQKRTMNMPRGPQSTSDEGSSAKLSGDNKREKGENGDVPAKKHGVEMPKSCGVKFEKPESSKNVNKKRSRKQAVESSDSEDSDFEDGVKDGVGSSKLNGHHCRRSSRQKQNVSYQENLSDDDGCVSPPKRSRDSKSSTVGEEEIQRNSSFPSEKKFPSENGMTRECNVKGKEEEVSDHSKEKSTADNGRPESKSNEGSDSEDFSYPDPEFHDFDKDRAESCFAADQTWAIYDPEDSMPRFYAIIKKVFSTGSELRITWLEANPNTQDEVDWSEEDLPIACGRFKLGATEKAAHAIFSHQMHCVKGKGRSTFLVYPRKGETWAVFQNWDIKWSSDREKHKPFKFDYVEVLSDFDDVAGVGVAYLARLKGFVSLFQRSGNGGVVSCQIVPSAMYCFSHRIPSFRMTGKEREGVPEGSYEFDPASLPSSFFKVDNHDDAKADKESTNAETHGLHPDSQKSGAECVSGFEEISVSNKHESKNLKKETPMARRSLRKFDSNSHISESEGVAIDSEKHDKNHKNRKNLTPLKRSAPMGQTDEKFNTPKKQESEPAAEVFKLRRSPRDVSKHKSEANGSQFTTEEAFTKQKQSEKVENSGCSADMKPNNCSSTGAAKKSLGAKEQSSKSFVSSPGTPRSKLSLPESFDFTRLKSKENFKLGQIWAMRTNGDLFPKTYGLVKRIESKPEFQVYVTLLDSCSLHKNVLEPVCCGIFRMKHAKAMVFPLSTLSHCVSAKPVDKQRYAIYPRKGEIWALYKSQNTDSNCPNPSKGECDIVEVLEDHDQSAEVLLLSRFGGSETMFKAPRIQRSKSCVIEIPRAEIARFSHQIPAIQHVGENDSCIAGCWELDPSSTPGCVICLD